jgi:hypothetical protein
MTMETTRSKSKIKNFNNTNLQTKGVEEYEIIDGVKYLKPNTNFSIEEAKDLFSELKLNPKELRSKTWNRL